jgi:hypothetical protein
MWVPVVSEGRCVEKDEGGCQMRRGEEKEVELAGRAGDGWQRGMCAALI